MQVKEEEKVQTPQTIPKTMIPYVQSKENSDYMKNYLKSTQHFIAALNKLLNAQVHDQNNLQPNYPFVIEKNYQELIVHLGPNSLQCSNKLHLMQCALQLQQNYSYPYYQMTVEHVQTLPKTLGIKQQQIHKKKELAGALFQDQKDTKNIPKNYCKAIITFAQKNQHLCLEILRDQIKVHKFLERISIYKKRLLNIKIFSSLLVDSDNPEQEEFNRAFRIISRIFIKKYAINYIFNSKIVQHNWHIRYREKIYKGVKNPKSFSHIKNL